MANGKKFQDLAFDWACGKATVPNKATPEEALKLAYGAKNNDTLQDAEKRYLTGKTGVTSKTIPEMWREAVVGLGKTPSNNIIENKMTYYRNT